MKKFIALVLFFVCKITVAQEQKPIDQVSEEMLYNVTGLEKAPEFPGGIKEFYGFIGGNFNPPKENEFKGGKVFISFVIEKDGSITGIKVLRDAGFGTGEEAIRVLKLCPNWSPGEQNGQKVRTQYSLPITIKAPVPNNDIADDTFKYGKFFEKLDKKPEFPGGLESFYRYIGRNYHVPEEDFPGGKVYATFVIEKDGSVTDVKVLKDVGFGTGAEAIRVLKASPKWNPGIFDGKPVNVLYSLPISLARSEEGFTTYERTYNSDAVEEQPEFLGGGIEKFQEYIKDKFTLAKYGELVSKVYFSFVVDEAGGLSNISIINDNGLDVKEEIMDLLKNCPKWKPGVHQRKNVKVKYVTSISVHVKSRDDSDAEAIYNYDIVAVKPNFNGGVAEFFKYVKKKSEETAEDHLKGKIYFSFVVEKDGAIGKVWVINSNVTKKTLELIKIFNESPHWVPGELNGKKVRTQLVFPIQF